MHRPSRWWLLLWLAACASPAPLCPAPTTPVAEVAPPVRTITPTQVSASASAAPRQPPPSPCWARGRPAAPKKHKKSDFCGPLDTAEVTRVEAAIRKDFVVYRKPSKLIIDFGCDLAIGDLHEVFFEEGSGHGGSLSLYRITFEETRAVVRKIEVQQYFNRGTKVSTATLDRTTFSGIIASSRVAALARPHLVELQSKNQNLSMSASFSSNDFHLRLSLIDEGDRVTDQGFTGYQSSGEQERSLPLQLAAKPLQKLLHSASFQPAEATPEDRAWLTDRFLFTLGGVPSWWVKERYVTAITSLGTIDAIPALIELIKQKGEASADRTRASATEAIKAITGWEPGGSSVDETAALIAQACAPETTLQGTR